MWKRKLLCVLTLCAVVLTATEGAGLAAAQKAKKKKSSQSPLKLMEQFDKKCGAISKQLGDIANKTVAYNKPATQKKAEEFNSDDIFEVTWSKNGTVVEGYTNPKNGKSSWYGITTTDPNLVFAGGVRVGASTKVLEQYFKGLLNRPMPKPEDGYDWWFEYHNTLTSEGSGKIASFGEDDGFSIEYKNGKITSISVGSLADWASTEVMM